MKVRLGLAGTGYWAKETHLPTFKACDGIDLVGVWGRNDTRARSLASKFEIARFERFEDMLGAVDAVSIVVAPEGQAKLALAAAAAGKHLFLEKPLATSNDDAARIEGAITSSGVTSIVFFMRRFVPTLETEILKLRKQRWITCRVRMLFATIAPGSPYEGSVWRNVGSAALWDLGPHVLSILFPILGPVRRVSATRRDDTVHMTTEHAEGASASIELSLHAAPKDAAAEFVFEGQGREGRLPNFVFTRETRRAACGLAIGALLQNIADGKRAHPCDAHFAALGVPVLTAAEKSISTGRPITPA